LDKVTAEIMRMEDETERFIEKFIEQTKDFENNLKSVEGKEVKEKAVAKFSKEEALASIKSSQIYIGKGNLGNSTSWPTVGMLREKSDETLKQLRIKKIELGFYPYVIASLQFTFDDGTCSNKLGDTSRDLNKSFEFPEDKPIGSVKV